jgi:hypothetical protein
VLVLRICGALPPHVLVLRICGALPPHRCCIPVVRCFSSL